VKLVVDRSVCEGHARCLMAFPEVVTDMDDLGQPVLEADGEFGPELTAHAQLAVDNCPESALSIEDA
jgi:ferredoxin